MYSGTFTPPAGPSFRQTVPSFAVRSTMLPITQGPVDPAIFLAAAIAFGSNLAALKNGKGSLGHSLANSLVKGTCATIILKNMPTRTFVQTSAAVVTLVGTGFAIDSIMKKDF